MLQVLSTAWRLATPAVANTWLSLGLPYTQLLASTLCGGRFGPLCGSNSTADRHSKCSSQLLPLPAAFFAANAVSKAPRDKPGGHEAGLNKHRKDRQQQQQHEVGSNDPARNGGSRRPVIAGSNNNRRAGRAPGSIEACVEELRLAARERRWETFEAASHALRQRTVEVQRPKEIALALHACAKAGRCDMWLVHALLERALEDDAALLRQANGHDHSNLWWALAILALQQQPYRQGQGQGKPFPRALAGHVLSASTHNISGGVRSLGFVPQGLANILWAYAKLHNLQDIKIASGAQLQRALCSEVAARLNDASAACTFDLQALNNIMWACAALDIRDASLMQPLCREAVAQLAKDRGHFTEQALSNMLWACATLDIKDAGLQQALCSEVAARLTSGERSCRFIEQALSNMLWACAMLQLDERRLAEQLAGELASRLPSGKVTSQMLSNAAWALAKMERRDLQWFYQAAARAVVDACVDMRRPGVSPQAWSNLLWGLSAVRHYDPELLAAACRWLCTPQGQQLVVQRSNSQDCSNLLLALAHLGWYDEQVTRLLLGRLVELLQQPRRRVEAQHIATSLWALAASPPGELGRHGAAVDTLLAAYLERHGSHDLHSQGLVQLWQLQAELAAEGDAAASSALPGGGVHSKPGMSTLGSQLRSALDVDKVRAALASQDDWSSSKLQQDVLHHIQLLMRHQHLAAVAEVRSEELVQRGGLCNVVDVWVRMADGREVVVEVDGPVHFMANEGHRNRKDGSTQLRDRQLARVFGEANVACVPYWEWRALQGKEDAKLRYLADLLERCSVQRQSTVPEQ